MDESLKDQILEMLGGEVDDYTGSKIPVSGKGDVTITISTGGSKDADMDADDDLPADHDIEMCKGGCAMHKGGMVEDETPDYGTFLKQMGI